MNICFLVPRMFVFMCSENGYRCTKQLYGVSCEFPSLLRQWCITAIYQNAGKQCSLRSITTNPCEQPHHHHAALCRHPLHLHQRPELKIDRPLSSPSHHVRPAFTLICCPRLFLCCDVLTASGDHSSRGVGGWTYSSYVSGKRFPTNFIQNCQFLNNM